MSIYIFKSERVRFKDPCFFPLAVLAVAAAVAALVDLKSSSDNHSYGCLANTAFISQMHSSVYLLICNYVLIFTPNNIIYILSLTPIV